MRASVSLKLTVQDGELWRGLDGKKVYHCEVKKLCSDAGFEQRCTVRRKVHSRKMPVRFVF